MLGPLGYVGVVNMAALMEVLPLHHSDQMSQRSPFSHLKALLVKGSTAKCLDNLGHSCLSSDKKTSRKRPKMCYRYFCLVKRTNSVIWVSYTLLVQDCKPRQHLNPCCPVCCVETHRKSRCLKMCQN